MRQQMERPTKTVNKVHVAQVAIASSYLVGIFRTTKIHLLPCDCEPDLGDTDTDGEQGFDLYAACSSVVSELPMP